MGASQGALSIAGRLADSVGRWPLRTAIVERDRKVSYAELDVASRAIAARIQDERGAHPGFVALLFESRIPAIEAMFGASRCGRAYVPLDAGDPDARLRLILGDSDPAVLMTERTLLARARSLAADHCTVIAVEDVSPELSPLALAQEDPESLANLYYTSGSTGEPKGVSQTHRNVIFFAEAYARTLRIGATDRVSLLYTLSFSASMMDIFGALFNGATLCAYDVRRDGLGQLGRWLDLQRISVLHAVPTVFRGLFGGLASRRTLEHLRAIDLGGETVFESDVELFRAHARADCILVNHLAATEANVIAQYVVEHDRAVAGGGILPVGTSPEGVSVQIRREDGSEAPAGEAGTLVVSSAYLSPGYWRRPELTAAAFSPYAPGAPRCYLTGDLACIDRDGNLHFLGRKGSRVKLRGQSIDLAEVEAALARCPGIVESAVVASGGAAHPEGEALVACVVMAPDEERAALRIRRHLAQRLPSYMLPGRFVFLDVLPRTATGKIDRGALARLPARDASRPIDPPRDDTERAVAAMFEQLLNESPIGRDDDFFLLGGDSLSLFELQSRVLDRFGVSVTRFYEDATVSGIATRIARARESAAALDPLPVLFAIKETGSAVPMFIVHGRLGQPFISPQFLRLLGDDLPVWAFRARGLDGRDPPHTTIEAMAEDYVDALRTQRPRGPYFLAALCAGALIASVMARALRAAGESVLPLLLFDPPEARMRASVTDQDLLLRIRARKEEGRSLTPIEDPRYATAAVRTARAFEMAIWQHVPQPYDGPVFMLSSGQRMANPKAKYLSRIFTGRVERFEVGTTHAEALDPRTPAFAAHLARCLERILGSDPVARNGEPHFLPGQIGHARGA